MKKGLRKSISSIVAAIMLSGSFIFAPIDLPKIGLKGFMQKRDPAAPQVLTYDESTQKYLVDGVEQNDFPSSGDFILGSDVVITGSDCQTISDSMSVNLNGYDIIDKSTSDSSLFIIKGTFTLSDSTFDLQNDIGGSLIVDSSNNTRHRAFKLMANGVLNITSGYVEGFTAKGDERAGAVDIDESASNSKFNFSGGVIRNCSSSSSTGGGAVSCLNGTFTMSGYATITECRNDYQNGADKKGNGAGVQVGSKGTMVITDHASITYCTGTGYHGAGIDFWSSSTSKLTISGSPTIMNNICGRGYDCNLYCGQAINVGDLVLSYDNDGNVISQVGITIQQTPIFTKGASANNNEDINDLADFFTADRLHATDIDNASIYSIEPHDNTELKQTPTIKATLYIPDATTEEGWVKYKEEECVPIGYMTTKQLGTKAYGDHSIKGWNTEKGKTVANFTNQTTTGYHDFSLYEVVLPKVSGHSISCFPDGSLGINAYVTYSEKVGYIDSGAVMELSGFSDNPNESSSINLDTTIIKTIGSNQYVVVSFKIDPYDLTKSISETITCSNGFSFNTGVQPSNIGSAIVKGNGYADEDKVQAAKQLASSILIFGSNLQNQLGYWKNKSGDLATKGVEEQLLTHESISEIPNLTDKSVDIGDTDLAFYGSSVVYRSNIQIKHYIKLNGVDYSGYTYSIDGEGSYQLELDNSGNYIFAKVNVPAYNLGKSYCVEVKDGSGIVVMTINYSVHNYINGIITNSSKQGSAVYNTVQSLYWYGEDAKAYAQG